MSMHGMALHLVNLHKVLHTSILLTDLVRCFDAGLSEYVSTMHVSCDIREDLRNVSTKLTPEGSPSCPSLNPDHCQLL